MKHRLVIVGASGHGRELLDVLLACNAAGRDTYEVLGFLDDGAPPRGVLAPYGLDRLGPTEKIQDFPDDVGYLIGIGSPDVKRSIDDLMSQWGRFAPVVRHPNSRTSVGVSLGAGCVLFSGTDLTNNISLGRHVHVNRCAQVGHDCRVGDYGFVGPLAVLSGNVALESEVFVGASAVVNPGLMVGSRAVVGAGAVVTKDVPSGVTVVGVPARPLGASN